jgi:four helix bundle protein
MSIYGQEASRFGFEDLEVYKAARAFRTRIYKLVKLLPAEEKFGLAQQMRRAAVSVTNNIAEGYGRHHWQENTHFCRHSRGSLMELIDDINVCLDEKCADQEKLETLKEEDALSLLKLLHGYISYLQRQKACEA